MAKVIAVPNRKLGTPCWIWQGWKNGDGYGIVKVNYVERRAHRVFYEHFVGGIPEGLELMHQCDMPECVNPDHLKPGTHAENMTECRDRGRLTGPVAENAAKTHCLRGHEFTTAVINGKTRRRCKTCEAASAARRWAEGYRPPSMTTSPQPSSEDEGRSNPALDGTQPLVPNP